MCYLTVVSITTYEHEQNRPIPTLGAILVSLLLSNWSPHLTIDNLVIEASHPWRRGPHYYRLLNVFYGCNEATSS